MNIMWKFISFSFCCFLMSFTERGQALTKDTLFFETKVYTDRWFTKMVNGTECNSILAPALKRADSLLKSGNHKTALIVYLGVLDSCEEFSAIELYLLKKVADIYLMEREHQKAFDFLRKYEWSASQQITYGKGHMPDGGIVWCEDGGETWGPTMKELKILEKELGKFGRYLDKLQSRYLGSSGDKIEEAAHFFIETYKSKSYSLNYRLWSDSLKVLYLAKGSMDSLRIERMVQGWGPDSVKIDSVALSTSDRAEVFVREFGTLEGSELPFSRVSPATIVYGFVRESDLWKFSGFKY